MGCILQMRSDLGHTQRVWVYCGSKVYGPGILRVMCVGDFVSSAYHTERGSDVVGEMLVVCWLTHRVVCSWWLARSLRGQLVYR